MSSTPLSTPPESAAEMFTVAAALGGAAVAVVVAATTDVAEATTVSSARYANLRFISESLLSRGRSGRPRFANLLAAAFSPLYRTFKLSKDKRGRFPQRLASRSAEGCAPARIVRTSLDAARKKVAASVLYRCSDRPDRGMRTRPPLGKLSGPRQTARGTPRTGGRTVRM